MSTQGALPFNKRKRGDLPPLPSSSSSSKSGWKYEVFLSFRGEDTRKSFTDHLYYALKKKGIFTFRDDERLERGASISEELLKAIEESRFAIVIFSENYASSRWCLDELVHIVRCKDKVGLKVVPIFYHVNPSAVRHQEGTFAQAFDKHEERFKESIEKVETWRAALSKVANLSGWDLQDRHEFEFIQQIVEDIMEKLSPEFSRFTKNLVGIDSIMERLFHLYFDSRNRVYMLGICGMGGLGKTTLARAICHRYSKFFEGSSFIYNVRERSKSTLLEIQQQLLEQILGSHEKIWDVYEGVEKIKRRLCQKKVLLVLDDVDHVDQLENLAGEHDWFGLDSWIIITTRDQHVLDVHGVPNIYKPKGLGVFDASKLFCLKAFKKEQPKEGYVKLSEDVVKYARRLPLALVTLGSFLVGRTVEEWQSALESFKKIKGDIHDILKISYDGLEDMWKEIFLDIACFFKRRGKDHVIEILKNCGFNAEIGISVLVDKSLLTIDDNKYLGMHDLLAEMGQKIIRFESGGNLGRQSRLWLVEDLLHVLENDMATEEIQAIVVKGRKEDFNLEEISEIQAIAVKGQKEDFNLEEISEGFSKMSNLRLLIIDGMNSLNDQRHLALPNNLRYLQWNFCPFKWLASSHKRMAFVQLDLQYGKFEYLWEGVMRSVNLKFIDLSHSENLIRTPDFSGVPILEELRLSYCGRLVEIHPSIGQLSKLRFLNLEYCNNLTDLPCMSAVMQSLTVLNLSCCSKLSLFPKFTGILKSLLRLNLARTAIKKVEPSSIECLPALTSLDLSLCSNLECLPSNMDNLKYLKFIDLSRSENLIRTPDFSGVPILEELRLSFCGRLVEIHPSIGQLSRLRYLDLEYCTNLTDLPCMSAVMQSLTVLDLSRCFKISSFPKFTGIMKSLSRLHLTWTAIKKVEPSSIECLPALTSLDLSVCTNLECLPSNMDNLRSLKTLDLSQCSKLKSLARLPSNVRCIRPEGFSLLNSSPEGVKLRIWSQTLSQWLPFDESGCLVGFTILFGFLRALRFHKPVLGGYIIRSWSAVKEGFSINIKLPSNWYNSKWIGFALWASLPQLPCVVEVKDGIRARVITPGGMSCYSGALGHSTTYINGICLLYLSREVWFGSVGNDKCSQITVIFENRNDNSSSSSFVNDNSSDSTVHIWGECGVSFIYKQGVVRVDELNETNAHIESFGEVSVYKLTGGDDDVHIVDDDDVMIDMTAKDDT